MSLAFAPDENGYASGERDLVGGFVFIVGAGGYLIWEMLFMGMRGMRGLRGILFLYLTGR